MLAGRQHGDHDLGILHGSRRIGHDDDAIVPCGRQIFRNEVETVHGVAGLDQIGGHRVAHIAKADEGDRRHLACSRVRAVGQ